MKKMSKLLMIILLFIPFYVNGKSYNYEDTTNRVNNYITNFEDYIDYIVMDNMPYNYDKNENKYNALFKKGGLLSKDEYLITNIFGNSYLATGIEYWTLTQHSNQRQHVINYTLSDRDVNSKSDIKVTEFVKNEVKVAGEGTKNKPWYFLEVFNVNLYSSNKNRGTLSLKKCDDVSEGNERIVVNKYGEQKAVFYVCEHEDYIYYKSSCSNYIEHIANQKEYYISNDIKDNTICRIDFGYKTYLISFEECEGCSSAPEPIYLAKNHKYYFEDKYGEQIIYTITSVPTKIGYTFEGYYTQSNGKGIKIVNADKTFESTEINTDTILKANMEANKYTITLQQNNATTKGTETIPVTFDSDMNAITPPQRKHKITYNANGGTITKTSDDVNYTFNGYYLNSKKYYNGNGTSAAKWDVASNSTLTEKWSTTGINLPSGTRTNYTFEGWYTSASGGTKVGDANQNYKPTSDITLYAHWKIIDGVEPSCTLAISSDGTKIKATYSDNAGGSGIDYYGWNSSYSGEKSSEKTASNGSHVFYVMDKAGNKKTCSVELNNTPTQVITKPGTCDSVALTYQYQNSCNYSGGCNVYNGVYSCTYNTNTNKCDCIINAFRTASGGHYCCNCNDTWFTGSWNSSAQKYQCKKSYPPTTRATKGCSSDEFAYKYGWCAKYW